jgi:glycine/D-amino acid oxidase-like deaminating enzyme
MVMAERCLDLMPEANRMVRTFTGNEETYSPRQGTAQEMGMNGVILTIGNVAEGSIDTGRMMRSLTNMARNAGVELIAGLGIRSIADTGSGAEVLLDNGFTVKAGHVHVATNGFAKQLIPELDVLPARAQVLITSPIEGLRVRGTFHMDAGYYYFRDLGDRILLGGGRNLDIEGETTSETGLTVVVQQRLEQLLSEVILPGIPHQVAHRWSGVMGVGGTRDTLLRPISAHVSCGVRLGGMGVALGSLVGLESAEMILGKSSEARN